MRAKKVLIGRLILIIKTSLCLTAIHSQCANVNHHSPLTGTFIFNDTEHAQIHTLKLNKRDLTENNDDNNDCICVPYYLCDNGIIDKTGTGIIDIRFGESKCESFMDLCCTTQPLRQPRTPAPIKREGCGFRNENGIGFRITGDLDNEAQYGEFPWMIAVLKTKNSKGDSSEEYLCGGSLINSRFVLTAAHCVASFSRKPELLKARGGEWDTQMTKELFPHVDRNIKKVIIHEKFYSGGLHNDIALLVLEEPFDLASYLDIVCLPHQGDIVLDDNCYVAGWGKDNFGREGKYQVILKRAELPMVPRETCENALRSTVLGTKFELHESFVCAGGIKGVGACKGDGGSALVCPIKGSNDMQYQQVGIVAWGVGCGSETPGMYVNVAHFVDWIYEHMDKFGVKQEIDHDFPFGR